MDTPQVQVTSIWAQLFLCAEDCARIRDFFVSEFNIRPRYVVRNMHITVYHARRPMAGVVSVIEPAPLVLAASDTRFMVMAPGGENPRPEVDPGRRTVGIRVHKRSVALPLILEFRDRLLQHETQRMLGKRRHSTHKTSAFGARHYQPHMAILRAGSGVASNLTEVGIKFRELLGSLTFDRFVVDVSRRPIDSQLE